MIDPSLSKCNGDYGGLRGCVVGAVDGSSVRTTLSSVSDCSIVGPGLTVSPRPPMSPSSVGLAPEIRQQKRLLLANNGMPPASEAGSHQGPAVAAVELGVQPASMKGNGIVHHHTLCRCEVTKQEKETTKRYFDVDCSEFRENQVSLPKGKEISGIDSFCDYAPLSITAQNGEVNKAVWAAHGTSDTKSLTQVCEMEDSMKECMNSTTEKELTESECHKGGVEACDTETGRNAATCSHFRKITYFAENKGSLLKAKGTSGSADSSCGCFPSTKTAGNKYVHEASGQAAFNTNNDSHLTQIFVKVEGKVLSMQENLNTTTVKELVDSACCKAGVQAYDVRATYGGRPLKDDKFIAYYPIFKDSTIHIRSGLRGGRKVEFDSETFEELMNKNMHKRFHRVTLSQSTTNAILQQRTATFLSRFSGYYIHKILVFVCGKHRDKKSFNGRFEINNILIVNGSMVQFDSSVQECDFSETTCSNDFAKLYEIFGVMFNDNGSYPLYFEHFLDYLFLCPAKAKSNSESLIKFLTNHPALTSYADRIKQCVVLDSMIHRLDLNTHRNTLDNAVGQFANWKSDVQQTPALNQVYFHRSFYDHKKKATVVNAEYTIRGIGCVHFSKNYFVHADYQLMLEEVEAAFAQTLNYFLPEILFRIAKDYTTGPAGFDISELFGNSLADPFTGK